MSKKKWDGEAADIVPTMTVNMLDKLVKGEDRDKQLIVGVLRNPGTRTASIEWIDVTGVSEGAENEDNVSLGTNEIPVKSTE